jgi:uncharacterized membrane protein
MATRTITRLYDAYADAAQVVTDLEAVGVPDSDISIVTNNRDDRHATEGNAGTGAATGATAGALIGGGAGLLAGIGALAIPGIGPVVAAGWLVSTLAGAVTGGAAGAATGGLTGSLTKSGVPDREAHVYAEGVRRGGSLVTVRTDDARAVVVERIMDRRRSINWTERDRTYRSEGWERFDPDAPAYTPPAGAGHGPVRTDRY